MFARFAVLAILAALSSAPAAVGQENPPLSDMVLNGIHNRIVQFFDGVKNGQAQSAFEELLKRGPLRQQTEAFKSLVARTTDLESKYGHYRGSDRVSSRRIGTDLILAKYLYKCDNVPVVWYFTFYRAPGNLTPEDDDWRVIAVRFDTDLDALWY